MIHCKMTFSVAVFDELTNSTACSVRVLGHKGRFERCASIRQSYYADNSLNTTAQGTSTTSFVIHKGSVSNTYRHKADITQLISTFMITGIWFLLFSRGDDLYFFQFKFMVTRKKLWQRYRETGKELHL